ncbi:glycosyltransferase [Ornithinimicrobium kibberense]|uniref:Glycosyltransferase n=2 Tax=Ornithinimicrobium kibberense TaxID=282060 RepID=A0ABV5V1Q1_9MICO|nr:glycosyltransferase [Ornithinimicrobium kibberense]
MRVLRLFHSGVMTAWRARERELRRLGHDVRLLSARRWDEGGAVVTLRPDPREKDVDVVPVATVGRHPALFAYDPRPIWLALGERWDVLDLHEEPFAVSTFMTLVMRRLRRNRAPYALYSAQNIDKRYPIPFRWWERWALRHARAVIVCNTEAGEICRRKGFPGVPDIIPLGVDVDRFSPADRQPPAADAPVQVGYVGRLAPHKGVDVLFDAVAAHPELELTVVGAGPQEDELRQRGDEPGLRKRVHFAGTATQEELPGLLQQMDVLAVPSLTTPGWVEQFGRVVVEAMAAGVPVVSSDSGALPDVVGEAGLVVPEGDPAALGEALLRVGREPGLWERLRQAGLERAHECSWEQVAQRYDEVYRRMTHSARGEVADTTDPEVVVVAYGSAGLLRAALEPVRELDVTVVDNSSLPEIRELCDELGVRYLDPGWNGGFGAGVNHALAHRVRPGSDVLLLNPDAVVSVEGVRALHRALRAEPDLASVAPGQVDDDGRAARVAWPFPTPVRSWVEAVGLGSVNDRRQDYVIGSVLMLRAEALAQVGGMDEDFFLYAEETDWARRAALMGWRHRLVPEVTAMHVGAATSNDPVRRETYFHAGQERYLRKHFGEAGWQAARAAQWAGAAVRSVVLPGERGRAARERAALLRQGPRRVERERFPRPERPAREMVGP